MPGSTSLFLARAWGRRPVGTHTLMLPVTGWSPWVPVRVALALRAFSCLGSATLKANKNTMTGQERDHRRKKALDFSTYRGDFVPLRFG